MANVKIVFGGRLPPLPHMEGTPPPEDVVTVEGEPGDVAHTLATRAHGGAWPEFTRVATGAQVFVNPALVRYVEPG
jgi:hypothetical protein